MPSSAPTPEPFFEVPDALTILYVMVKTFLGNNSQLAGEHGEHLTLLEQAVTKGTLVVVD